MKVFVSWSGDLSKRIAEVLHQYLPVMLQGLEVFMSKHDLESGSRWSADLAKELEGSNFGIICLTPDNLTSPWLLFEAGALTKHIEARACGLLIGELRPTDVTGPLSQFQHRQFSQEDVATLLRNINTKLAKPLEIPQVQIIFEKWWPDIERDYQEALKNSSSERTEPHRTQQDLMEEMLDRIRSIERTLEEQTSSASFSGGRSKLPVPGWARRKSHERLRSPGGLVVLTKEALDLLTSIIDAKKSGGSVSMRDYADRTHLFSLLREGFITVHEGGEISLGSLPVMIAVAVRSDEPNKESESNSST